MRLVPAQVEAYARQNGSTANREVGWFFDSGPVWISSVREIRGFSVSVNTKKSLQKSLESLESRTSNLHTAVESWSKSRDSEGRGICQVRGRQPRGPYSSIDGNCPGRALLPIAKREGKNRVYGFRPGLVQWVGLVPS